MDEYNPLRAQVREQTAALDDLTRRIRDNQEELDWFDGFDEADMGAKIAAAEDRVRVRDVEVAAAHSEVVAARAKVSDCKKRAIALQKRAQSKKDGQIGLSPLGSILGSLGDLRATRKLKREVTALLAVVKTAEDAERAVTQKRDQAEAEANGLREELARHAAFDPAAAHALLAELTTDAESRTAALDGLTERVTALDDQLAGPLPELISKKRELSDFEGRLARALEYQSRLDATSDKTARWRIHKEREDDLGHTPLRDVIREAQRAIPPLQRAITKLEERVRDIVLDHTRDIRKLVIDGNNLCYVDRDVVGLWPLREVLAHVDGQVEVRVFFDDSIVETLNLVCADQVYKMLPDARIRIAPPGTRADEEILDAADEPGAYVLSNDRFTDFPDKPAVRESRVLRHQIDDGRIKVRGLQLDTVYRTSL